MNNYHFSLSQNTNLVGEGYGFGANALEAFEQAVNNGSVILQMNEPVTVIAVNDSGLGLKFEVNKTF